MTHRRTRKASELPPEVLLDLYVSMLRIRRFEEKIVEVYPRQDMKTPVHLSIGQEAVAAGVCLLLRKDDYITSNHRSHGHCLAKGIDARSLYAEFYGRSTGCCHGRAGSMHPADPEHGVLGTSGIVGGGVPHAVGMALASQIRQDGRIAVSFFGDGAVEEGTFHESLNFAALHKLPVLFVCENNFWAVASPLAARQPHGDIYRRAAAVDIPAVQIDGNDASAVYQAAAGMVAAARGGQGPQFIEAWTYRWKGHVGPEADWPKKARPKEELDHWVELCPLKRHRALLEKLGLMTEASHAELLAKIDAEMSEAMIFAQQSPLPDASELLQHLYAEKD